MNRRRFLGAGLLVAAAPAIVRSGVLMPVRVVPTGGPSIVEIDMFEVLTVDHIRKMRRTMDGRVVSPKSIWLTGNTAYGYWEITDSQERMPASPPRPDPRARPSRTPVLPRSRHARRQW